MSTRQQLRAEFARLDAQTRRQYGGISSCECGACENTRFDAWVAARRAGSVGVSLADSSTASEMAMMQQATNVSMMQGMVDAIGSSSRGTYQWVTESQPISPSSFDPASVIVGFTTPASVEMTDKERILAKLSNYFANIIPDDEVTDMGDYLLWHGYAGQPFVTSPSAITGGGSYTIAQMREYSFTEREIENCRVDASWVYPSSKMLMVEGMFRSENGTFRRYIPSERSRSLRYVEMFSYGDSDYGTFRAGYSITGNWAPCTLRDIPQRYRLNMVEQVTALKYDEGLLGGEEYSRRRSALRAFRARSSGRAVAISEWRGVELSEFHIRRRLFKELGEMIRCPDDASSSFFVEALGNLALDRNKEDALIDLWNTRETMSDGVTRASCGHLCSSGDTYTVRGDYGGDVEVCESCNETLYVDVEDTGDRRRESSVFYHGDGEYYSYRPSRDDDDYDEDETDGPHMRSYSTNVLSYCSADDSIQSSQFGDFLMGVELEVVARSGCRDNALRHTNKELCPDYAIMKSDGSLAAGGFEIVTAPRGLAEHLRRFKEWAPHDSLRAWDAGCCGLHVHISSQAFSQATLGKYIEFINSADNARLIRAIAGRHAASDKQAAQYCKVEGSLSSGNPKKNVANKHPDRYYMVNTTNMDSYELNRLGLNRHSEGKTFNTVELRIFRASLKKERLLAQIEFAHAAVMFCRATSMRELRQQHFLAWLQKAAGMYPHLAKWFGVKANSSVIVEEPPVQSLAEV